MTNTYEFPGKEDVELIIGDEKQVDFFPRMKIKRWDNEVNFSVGVVSEYQGVNQKVADKVEWNDGHGVGAKFYQKSSEEFEFEISLDRKPLTGFVLLSIETKGLDFFYQPPLTQKEIDDGNIRPDNVVGSYAVYHQTMKGDYSQIGGKNYRAGKAFHIYRPKAFDDNGEWAWCEMNISGGGMKITMPQPFLDTAKYPIIIDPTFGYDSVGASIFNTSADAMYGSLFTSPSDMGTVQKIWVYMKGQA